MITTKAVLKKVFPAMLLLLVMLCLPVQAETNLFGGSGLFQTHSSDIIDEGLWRTGLYLHSYEYKEPVDPKNFDFVPVLSYSPFPKAELMASVPIRRHDDSVEVNSGLADGFIGLKYLAHPMLAGLVYGNIGWGDGDVGSDSGSTDLGFMAISSQWVGPVRFDLNTGYQFTDLGGDEGSDLFLWGVGASYPLDSNLLLFGEWVGAITTEGNSRSPSGFSAGVNYYLNERIELTAGGGTGLVAQGTFSPDWRVFAGLTYTFGAEQPFGYEGEPGEMPPPPPPPKEPVDEEMAKVKQRIELVMIRFPYDRIVISDASKEKLDEIVTDLKKYPRIAINITGHADSRGTASYNKILGMRRAEAVKKYLVSQGINGDRIAVSSQGELKPIAPNDTKGGRIQNRRATFSVGIP